MNRTLVLVRHGQSEWNAKNLFTGWKNPDLTPLGIEEARRAGRELKKGYSIQRRFTLRLLRAQHTIDLIFEELGQTSPDHQGPPLNERHYGDLSAQQGRGARQMGEEQVAPWRRSYDVPPQAARA
jgi:2,3-bisphosphoglycerate-dependent phosphoglycerate mutase